MRPTTMEREGIWGAVSKGQVAGGREMYDTAWEAEVGIDMSISVDDKRGNEGVDDDGEEDGWIR
jgi:hypothetical protein